MLYGQYILDLLQARPTPPQGHEGNRLACKITRICLAPLIALIWSDHLPRHSCSAMFAAPLPMLGRTLSAIFARPMAGLYFSMRSANCP